MFRKDTKKKEKTETKKQKKKKRKEKRWRWTYYRWSASPGGPVETGFRYVVSSPGLYRLHKPQRTVLNTVLPTSVFAPQTWYMRNERCNRAPGCRGIIFSCYSWFLCIVFQSCKSLFESQRRGRFWEGKGRGAETGRAVKVKTGLNETWPSPDLAPEIGVRGCAGQNAADSIAFVCFPVIQKTRTVRPI